MPEKSKSNELKLIRLYNAPVEMVWAAWTDPKRAAKWWGPRGFTITTHGKDLRPGGFWHYTMHGPDGADYPNKTIYYEVEEQRRLVYDHGANDDQPPLFRVTVTFEKKGDRTQMDMTMAFPSPEIAEQSKKFIKLASGNSTWDRLAEYLEKESSQNEIFVINESFNAPIEKVFEMWVNPKHFSQWLAPTGAEMEYIQSDIAEGKTSFYKMTFEGGLKLFGKIKYQKITPPNGLEYVQMFSDEKGNLGKHPLVPVWPTYMASKVEFSQEGDDQTRVTVYWQPSGDVTAEEIKAFSEMKASMTQGWSGSFDKLESYLAKF